jgi:succinate dehydrogenase/fumarate reductase flavoprotein subunit
MSTKGKSDVTRRDLVRTGLAGAALTGVAAASPAAQAAPLPVPKKWDYAADVVCIGYGGAGAATAITAHDAGAKVLILEKMPHGGGNTRVSAGGVLCPSDTEEAFKYITALYEFSHSDMDAELVRIFCEQSVKNVDWLKALRDGTQVAMYGGAGFPKVPGAKSMRKYAVQGAGKGMSGSSDNLWDVLSYAVEQKRRIELLTEAPAQRLVTNAGGEVIGVIALYKGREIAVRARRGVVLTAGGYEFDDKIKKSNLKGYPICGLGNPGNTGDGVRMAQALGAQLWHMNGAASPFGIRVKEFESALYIAIGQPGFIYVDRHGKRFIDEKSIEAHAALLAVDWYDAEELIYPRIPCYAIFDEETRLKGPISTSAGRGYAGKRYKWSNDNSAEIEKGWIIKADTLAELAGKIKVKPEALQATLSRGNADVKSGADTEFHRPVNAPANDQTANAEHRRAVWSASIERAPFYAMELYPSLMNTQGGPKRNARAQVMDVFGKPVPRLYSAGELGSMWGVIYQGAGNIAECIVFGQIAGRNAATEKPWG